MSRHTDTYAHGTRSRYVMGCRCPECREANRVAGLRYRHTGSTIDKRTREKDAPTQPGP